MKMRRIGGFLPERYVVAEKREVNAQIRLAGGNAGKTSLRYEVGLPAKWARGIGLTKENPSVSISYNGKRIIITKDK